MAGADKTLGDLFELAEAGGLGVKVGVLEGAVHTDEKGRSVPVAEYAMANEYGTRRIPPRAAFRSTADARMGEWEDLLATRLWDGVDPRDALIQAGGRMAADIQEAIDQWTYPPNKPSTIARKRSKRDNPLVDSGDLLDAVDFALTGPGE